MSNKTAVLSAVVPFQFDLHKGVNGTANINDAVYLSASARVDTSISAVAAQTAALTGGLYDVWSDVDCYLRVAATAGDVTSAAGAKAGYLLRANNTIPLIVPDGQKIGAVAGGAGTLYYHRIA